MTARESWTETRDLRRCNIFLPSRTIERLDTYATEEGVARSEIVRRALRNYLDARDKQEARTT